MGYYIDQLAEQDRQKRLADLLAMQQDNSEPGVQYDTPQQPIPQQGSLSDLMNSGASRDQINAMLSQSTMTSPGFDAAGTTGRGESYMPPQELPVNMIRNNTTGRVFAPTDLQGNPSQSQSAGLAADWSRPVDVMGAKGHWASDNSGRIILRDGRIVDPGRDTGAERARMKEDLGLQKTRAEIDQMRAKPQVETPEQKRANEIIAAAERSKLPYTAEGARLAEQARADAKAKAGEEGKPLPISAAKGLMENQQNLRRAQEAQALLNGQNVGKAVGDKEATGWKGYAPDYLLQRLDPAGIDTRAAIADLGSLVIHDRSGAAVTAMEFPRLRPFIPSDKDDPATARKKLNRFVMEYQNIVDEATGFYKESGYKVPSEKLKNADIKRPANDGIPPMETWVAKAKELNPDMSGAEIEAEYMKKYRR